MLQKPATLRTLRQSVATQLLEANTDVRVIRVVPGHAKLTATAQCTHVATKTIIDTVSRFWGATGSGAKTRPGGMGGGVPPSATD